MRVRERKKERERLRERERVRRERNSGRWRVTPRANGAKCERESIGETSRRSYAGNLGRAKLTHSGSNWRDNKDITSLYFSRFAEDITEKDLWYHFKRWGDVREIFIPKRRNLAGRRYGFVRFKGVQDIPFLVKKLDSIVIGGLKLFVNLPKYGREKGRETRGNIQAKLPMDRKQGGEFRNRNAPPISYADALRRNTSREGDQKSVFIPNNQHTSLSVAQIQLEPEDTLWLKEAWVAHLKNPAMYDRVEEELMWETGKDIRTTFMGDDQVLLLGLSEYDANQLINGDRTFLFSSIERWHPNMRVDYRLTWIQCWGIPVQAWNPKHFNQIIAAMGEVVDIDDAVEEKRRVDKARLLIRTQWRPSIQHTVEVMIDGAKFMVHINEESCQGHVGCSRRAGNAEGSSEEINSDDSMFDSSSHINWDHGDTASDLPELESCSNPHGGASQYLAGADDRGGLSRVPPQVSELLSAREEEVANSSRGTKIQQTWMLPAGFSDGCDPVGIYPRSIAETRVTPLPGHKFKSIMSMGCGMVPMIFPGIQQYMPPMGMGIGMGMGMGMEMGMGMGMSRSVMPFPNMLASSTLPAATAAAHLGPRFPMPPFHMPHVATPDSSRMQGANHPDNNMLNSLGTLDPDQSCIPNFTDPYQQYLSLQQAQLQLMQTMNQPNVSKPSTSRGQENPEKHQSGKVSL
ncbi:Transcription factor PIF1 [Glycine soja]|uniref:Transcription factor PIF1 n=1 Tax=Glycine soja TaxID=3848 RepID=A0A0B2PE36_GLYSO|nr:Transcription factor PIF1 [Glycine soja]